METIINIDHHRNGVGGAPFDVVLFHDGDSQKVAILFRKPWHCAVLDVAKLAAGDIAFGSNSWRGDRYEPSLRREIELHNHRKYGSPTIRRVPMDAPPCGTQGPIKRYLATITETILNSATLVVEAESPEALRRDIVDHDRYDPNQLEARTVEVDVEIIEELRECAEANPASKCRS